MASPRPETSFYALRPAAGIDVADILAIERSSFPVPWHREFFEGELESPGRYHRVLERLLPGRPRLAGYLFAVLLFDEFHITKIATHPFVRRQGHGRRLLEDGLEAARARRAASIVLEVRVSNRPAIDFYASYGFVEAHRRRHYYSDGEDASVLIFPLLDLPRPAR
jgi:[ribosomal protein S18]-alanine N-acetyltransferase